jgi:ABC-type multidrug transport system permease subunit
MNYVEVLRAFRGLRVIAILLGLILLAAAIARVSLSGVHSPEATVKAVEARPGAVVRRSTLSDGTRVTTVDVPADATHMVVRENQRDGTSVAISEPRARSEQIRRHGNLFGNFSYSDSGAGRVVVFEQYNSAIPFEFPLTFTLLTGFILATILAGALARENEHLELAWTKPVSRDRYALTAMGADLAAIVVGFLLTLVTITLAIWLFTMPVYAWSGRTLPTLGFVVLGPMAWYAMLTAASASLKRGLGAVIGIAWPVGFLVTALAAGPLGSSATAAAVYKTFHFLNYLNPLGYLSNMSSSVSHSGHMSASVPDSSGILMLAVLTVVYIAAAIFQWRRVEA